MATYSYPPRDFAFEVSSGRYPQLSAVSKFGRNPDTDTGSDPEDVWDAGGLWVAPTQARVHNIVSDDAADDAAGTGAQTVTVVGQDADGAEISEVVTMDGTTPVATSNSYIIIYRMIVTTAGSGLINAGDITATAVTDATVTAQISAGFGQTLMAIYRVPTNKTAYLVNWYAAMNRTQSSGSADCAIVALPNGGAWNVKHILSAAAAGASLVRHDFAAYPSFSAGTTLKVQIKEVSSNNTDISAGFDLFLEEAQ